VRSERHTEAFEAGLRSFVEEARLLAQFDHPALIKVYRFWKANGSAYMVMPFCEGITLRTLADWQGLKLDELTAADKEKLLADLKALTRREAAEIYRANYWLPMRCGDLPAGIDLMVFDFGVNAGPRRSVKLLQRAAGVTDDGSVGPKTLAAVMAADPLAMIAEMADERLAYYRSLDNFDAFGAGWTNRTQQVSALARAMSG